MQPDLEERLERIDDSAPIDTSNDRLTVTNIDTGCNDDTYDTVRISQRYRDPESGRILTSFPDINYHFNHAEGFQVRWASHPFTIKPGETIIWPRYLAQHFAFHLANHMLDKRGPNMRSNPVERPKTLALIITKEESVFGPTPDSVGEAAAKQIEAMNQDAPNSNVQGLDYSHGGAKGQELTEDTQIARDPLHHVEVPPEETEQVLARLTPESAEDQADIPEAFKSTSKAELVQSIRNMDPGYKFPETITKRHLVVILKKVAGV